MQQGPGVRLVVIRAICRLARESMTSLVLHNNTAHNLLVVDVVLRRGADERRISAAGRDIYAVTAPLVGQAARRLIDGRAKIRGAAAPGEAFDASEFLDALSPHHLTIRREDS